MTSQNNNRPQDDRPARAGRGWSKVLERFWSYRLLLIKRCAEQPSKTQSK